MSIGASGRIVIEVEPELKRELYAHLTRDGLTLKEWFLQEARCYLATSNQFSLDLSGRSAEEAGHSRVTEND